MNKVCVLLAAYNGELYIEQQLDSILAQKDISVELFISLDLSTDRTLDILKRYELENSNVTLLPYGNRFGAAAPNFYRLISDVLFSNFDYIAFADQDDIWDPFKLSSAVDELIESGSEGLSSDVIAFWEDGTSKLIKKSEPQVEYDHFFESPGPGCTFVVKSYVASLFKRRIENFKLLGSLDYHDWLFYAFVRGEGFKWQISKKALMQYRQHSSNQIGANSGLSSLVYRIKLISSGWYREQISLVMLVSNYEGILWPLITKKTYINNLKLLKHLNKLRRNPFQRTFLGLMIIFNVF